MTIELCSIKCKQLVQTRIFLRLLLKKKTHLLFTKINKMILCQDKLIKEIIQNLQSQDLLQKKVEENNLIPIKNQRQIN